MDTAVFSIAIEQTAEESAHESESALLERLGFKKARAIKKHPDGEQQNTYRCGCAGTDDRYRYTEAVASDGTIWILAGAHRPLEEHGFKRAAD